MAEELPETPQKKRHSHLRMVWTGTCSETEWSDVIVNDLVASAVTIFLALASKISPQDEKVELFFLAVVGGLCGVIFGFAYRFVFVTPAKLYKELEGKSERMEKIFDDATSQIEIAHKKLIESLESQIKTLNEQLDDKQKHQEAKELLAYKLLALENRLHDAKQISRYEFQDDLLKKEWEITKELFNNTEGVLTRHLSITEAIRFHVAKPEQLKEISDDPYFQQRKLDWQWHVNYIASKFDALNTIIKELG